MNFQRRERILNLSIELGAIKYGEFTLSSGEKSNYYFDGRLVTLNPEGLFLIAKEIFEIAQANNAASIGGPTLGADPIVGATVLFSHQQGYPLNGFIVRNAPKNHGMGNQLEGIVNTGAGVIIIDDTCSTGGSLIRGADLIEAIGANVLQVVTVLDRNQGGREKLVNRGYRFTSLLCTGKTGSIEVNMADD
jgi:orotate phosphoribosyltransferase